MERDARKEFLKNISRFVVSERMCWGYFTARRCGLILGEDVDIQIAKKSSECFLVSNDTWFHFQVSKQDKANFVRLVFRSFVLLLFFWGVP